jgi:hypothetical protein
MHMPRSIAQVNAIRGAHRSPSAEEELPGDGHDGFDPNQPRVPAGHSHGGRWTKTGAHGPASRREVEIDDADEEAWESVNSYRLDGTLAEQGVVNRDGSRIHSQFSLDPRMAGWDERHTVTLPDGQQITFENSGDVQTIYDADGQLIAANEWTSEGPQPHPMVQLARGKLRGAPSIRSAPGGGPGAGEAARSLLVAAGAALYAWFSSQDSKERKAVLAFKAAEYRGAETDKELSLAWVGRLTRDEVKQACKKLDDVQRRTDEAVDNVRKDGKYKDAADFGNKVHKEIEKGIKELNKPNYVAEQSFSKVKAEAGYGDPDSIRVDVLENRPQLLTVCIYDPKTGKRGLYFPRMAELASTVQRKFPGTQRFIVTEVRPGQK